MILRNCTLSKFFERCKNKIVACYGIGEEFRNAPIYFPDLPWSECVTYLVDSDSNKCGTTVLLQGKEYEIQSPKALFEFCIPDVIIIMPTKEYRVYNGILNMLDVDERLNNSECYMYFLMLKEPGNERIPIKYTGEFHIPPIIHYCWFGKKPMPDHYLRYMESWSKFCPNYEIKEWNEDNLDIKENAFSYEAYKAGKYGFVPDYFRLKIIYENGGIYLDTDVEILKNLDDLRREEAFCGLQDFGQVAFGLGFGAAKGNQIIRELMKSYDTLHFDSSVENDVVSPIIQTRKLLGLDMKKTLFYQKLGNLTIFPLEVLSPKNLYSFDTNVTEYSYAIHHYDGSWTSEEYKQKTHIVRMNISNLLKRARESEGNF